MELKKVKPGTIKVSIGNNKRIIEDEDIDVTFTRGNPESLTQRELKSVLVRRSLFTGDLRILEGEIEFNYKMSKIKISDKENNKAYISEFGKNFIKDLDTGDVMEVKEDGTK